EPAADEQEEKPALMRATGGRGGPPCPDGRSGLMRRGWTRAGTPEAKPILAPSQRRAQMRRAPQGRKSS
ncbi:MAG: hypothetical protein ACXWWV_05235, partial [Candidatus Deferrimicrobiaceae bacterium]